MKDETANSAALLREAIEAAQECFPDTSIGEITSSALAAYGVDGSAARELGKWMERIAASSSEELLHLNKKDLRAAVTAIFKQAQTDFSWDVPYLAGYAKDTPLKIYIDKGLKRVWTLGDGREVDIAPYLVLHEVAEKAFIDYLQISERAYLRAHQLAQRLEGEAVHADGISWKEYQYDICVPEIDKAYTKQVTAVPPDLDETPYREFGEIDLLLPSVDAPFEVRAWGRGMYHLQFKNPMRMAATMMRFQEYYESPVFRGTYLSREEFNAWYSERHRGASYIQDWTAGFNIPDAVLEPFYDGQFSPLTADETRVLEAFGHMREERYYLIATAEGSDPSLLRHEIAHALFFLDPAYARSVKSILAAIKTAPLRELLATHPDYSHYHEAVLEDEIHAHLAHNAEELAAHGVDLAPYRKAIARLGGII